MKKKNYLSSNKRCWVGPRNLIQFFYVHWPLGRITTDYQGVFSIYIILKNTKRGNIVVGRSAPFLQHFHLKLLPKNIEISCLRRTYFDTLNCDTLPRRFSFSAISLNSQNIYCNPKLHELPSGIQTSNYVLNLHF